MHADIRNRPALPYQALTHVECSWDPDGFHDDVEAVDFGVEVFAGRFADFWDGLGHAGVDYVSIRTRQHTLGELEASVGEVEESDASWGVETRCEAGGEADGP